MRKLQKLVRNGNSTQFTIPHQMLTELGWIAGDYVLVEVLEDRSLHLRYPSERDFVRPRRKLVDVPEPAEVSR